MQATIRIYLALAVAVLLLSGYSTARSTQTPFRADKLKKTILPAPPSLVAERGIHFFDLTMSYPKVIVNLYDASKSIIGIVEVTEDLLQNRVTLKISPTDMDEAWITIGRQINTKRILLSVDSSEGSAFEVRLERAEGPAGRVSIPIKSASLRMDGRWISLSLKDLKHQASSDRNQLRAIEQNRLFATPSLQLLRTVMHEYKGILDRALKTGNGSISPLSPAPILDGGGAGCSVTCLHVAELIPLYYCDGGDLSGCSCSAGRGFFFITGCTWILPCSVDCGAFGTVA
jgi:hypothetical protein